MLISFELEAEEEPEEFLLGQILVQTTQILLFKRDRRKRNGIQNIPQRARSTSWWVLDICLYLVCINFQSIQISTAMKRFHHSVGTLKWKFITQMVWSTENVGSFSPVCSFWHHLWADQGIKFIPDLIARFRELQYRFSVYKTVKLVETSH